MPRHFRRIPPHVLRQLREIDGRYIVAGCLIEEKSEFLAEGALSHIEVSLDGEGLHFQPEVLPPGSQGKFSARNTDGWVEMRRDWEKETYTVAHEAPNWHNSGTHTVYQSRERFPKIHHAPSFSTIRIECSDPSPGRQVYVLKCEVSDILSRSDPQFEERLLHCLNVLQENLGSCGVAKPAASFTDYATSLRVTWEVLPPGTKDETVNRVFRGRAPTPQERAHVETRHDFLMFLKPVAMIYGRSGLQRYFGAQLEKDLVVFENVQYGNAVYIMFEDWEILSQKSRIDLLSGRYGKGFERVVHSGDWQGRVARTIEMHKDFERAG